MNKLYNIETKFKGESLSSLELSEQTYETPEVRLLPNLNVLKIGGQSIMDRGKSAVYPIVDEIRKNKGKHQLLIGVGGGTRSRHAYSVALDMDMPTGILATLGASVSRQNARMLYMLLSKDGGIFVPKDSFEQISIFVHAKALPIICGMPPYTYWEHPPETGRIPPHRTDVGVFLMAESLGAKSLIFVKDEEGLYTADPKKDPNAKFIPKINIKELIELDLDDLIIERPLLKMLDNAHFIKKLYIINGLVPENITRALEEEEIGTIIYK